MTKLANDGGQPVITENLPSIADHTGRLIGEEEMNNVREVLESGTLAYLYGSKVGVFEKKFAELFGVKHAVAASSGTAALHIAMIYLNPEPGDEILVSPITDMGSVIPILYQQAIPVFVDVDPKTQNMDPQKIEDKISSRTRGIMVTHIYGNPADMDAIIEIADKYNLFVIEDAAQAHLAEYKGKYVGTLGDMGCFSFQQSKHITTGDGGIVITNEDKRFGRDLLLCSDKGWPRHLPVREHYFLAPNYHMTELQAAVGIAQLGKYQICVQNRQKSARELDTLLKDIPEIEPIISLPNCKNSYFYYCFQLKLELLKVNGERIVEALQAEGLKCELGYPGTIPLYLYPMIKDKKTFGTSGWPFNAPFTDKEWDFMPGLCPVAEKACLSTILLPWNECFKKEHINLISNAMHKVLGAFRK